VSGITAPSGFLWGAATSAYQVEGSPLADGAGPSIWHRFSHTPGRTRDGDHGDVACDQYHRWRDDIGLMRDLGLGAYRFSIAWARVLPEGTGRVNRDGLDYYERLVDGLLEAGIQPMVTLFHWDLPAALDDRGGWLNRDIAGWFADYTAAVVRALDDRVRLWATLNEPWVVMDGGYLNGGLAPGHRSLYEAPLVSHNLLRAHAEGVRAYRAEGRHEVGLVVNLEPQYPASDRDEDAAAARRVDAHMNRHYLDPVLLGHYPEDLAGIFGDAWPDFDPADLEKITEPIDFLGINYYTRRVTRDDPSSPPLRAAAVRQPQSAYTEMGWEVYPRGLRDTLDRVVARYGETPLYITENGAAFYDPPTVEGPVHPDPLRVAYLRSHIRTVLEAARDGIPVRGYFV
jgi:beta-glucosidase